VPDTAQPASAGGGSCSEPAVLVECDRTHGTEVARRFQIRMGLAAGFFLESLLQLLPALVGAEVRRVHQGDALACGEGFGTLPDHHHVRGMLHHGLGQQDRVAHALHAGHRAGLEGGAIHQRGIQFVAAIVGEHRAPACIEGGIVLEHGDRRGHGLQRRLPGCQGGMPLHQGLLQGRARRLFLGRR